MLLFLFVCFWSEMLKSNCCVFVGCCDNADDGPHYVNAASKHDGPSDPTDEPPVLGHNRNGKIRDYTLYLFCCKTLITYGVSQGNLLLLAFQWFTFLQFNIAAIYFDFSPCPEMSGLAWANIAKCLSSWPRHDTLHKQHPHIAVSHKCVSTSVFLKPSYTQH